MIDLSHINIDFVTFSEQDTISEAIRHLEQTGVSHIYVVDKDDFFVGVVAYDELLEVENQEQGLKEVHYLFQHFSVEEYQNEMDLLSLFIINEATVLPVVKHHKIIGSISLSSVLESARNIPFFDTEGTSFLISKEEKDYTLSQVVQIVESCGGKILGVFLVRIFEGRAYILIKSSIDNINEVLQAFRRYEYQILSNHQEDTSFEDIEENSKYLEKYLSF